jgi:hypothetical protein
MGIFDKIKDAIWGDDVPSADIAGNSETPVEDTYLGTTASTTGIVPDVSTAANDPALRDIAAAGVQPMSKPSAIEEAQAPPVPPTVDIAATLDSIASGQGQKLDWRHSIVDLMKVVGMDASLSERRELAAELNYQGDTDDSARMNTFLHKALLQKLAENGGKVPSELMD